MFAVEYHVNLKVAVDQIVDQEVDCVKLPWVYYQIHPRGVNVLKI